mmetsp:Transcript_28097/g.76232  ORF Transcript_28097/g.76232 Transcript_28097/m.76232 type:complete len:83 (+) Transcript_28097:114-362(+)
MNVVSHVLRQYFYKSMLSLALCFLKLLYNVIQFANNLIIANVVSCTETILSNWHKKTLQPTEDRTVAIDVFISSMRLSLAIP